MKNPPHDGEIKNLLTVHVHEDEATLSSDRKADSDVALPMPSSFPTSHTKNTKSRAFLIVTTLLVVVRWILHGWLI